MEWVGHLRDVESALALVGADRDPAGRFIVSGVTASLDGRDCHVRDESVYLHRGAPRSLLNLMRTTNTGQPWGVL